MSAIQWHKTSEMLPDDNDECVLLSHGSVWSEGNLYGPIAWKASATISTDQVSMWALWKDIAPADSDE